MVDKCRIAYIQQQMQNFVIYGSFMLNFYILNKQWRFKPFCKPQHLKERKILNKEHVILLWASVYCFLSLQSCNFVINIVHFWSIFAFYLKYEGSNLFENIIIWKSGKFWIKTYFLKVGKYNIAYLLQLLHKFCVKVGYLHGIFAFCTKTNVVCLSDRVYI